MIINLVTCMFVLDNEKNDNIRKSDEKRLKILMKKDGTLPSVPFSGNHMKAVIKANNERIIGTKQFHLEQVLSYDYKDTIDIIYLSVTNKANIKNLDKDYELIDFGVKNNNTIILGNNTYSYITEEVIENNNIDYIQNIHVEDEILKKLLLEILISFKRVRYNLDNTDIIYKFMDKSFTLEEVRIVYNLIKDVDVDKSNFRKKITKYCKKIDEVDENRGYRPSQKYKYQPLKGDIWI